MPEVHEKVLQFDTGLVTYHLNDQCDVVFNPTDSVFVERLYAAFNDLDKKQEAYQEQVSRMSDRAKIFDLMRERDKEMRELVDSVFDGAPVCAMLTAASRYIRSAWAAVPAPARSWTPTRPAVTPLSPPM